MESKPVSTTDNTQNPETQNQKGQRNYHQRRNNYRGRGNNNYRNNFKGGNRNQHRNQNYQMQQNRNYFFNYYNQHEMIYRTEMYIFMKYHHLIDINVKSKGLSQKLTEGCSFYVIKSFSEEDVHKAIKYGVWSSSKNGNSTLSNAFRLASEKNGSVYLFFSCNGSGRFVGVARMKTACDYEKTFEYWTQDQKWLGLFEIEWVFIKDIPFKEFKKIIFTMKDSETKPISNSRDCQEVPFNFAKTMIEIFENYQNINTILEHFEYYDFRQENYERQLKMAQSAQPADPSQTQNYKVFDNANNSPTQKPNK